MNILVSGANGFVGRAVCTELCNQGHHVVGAVRRVRADAPFSQYPVGDLGLATDWRPALQGMDAVIHLAARAHVMDDRESNPAAVFRAINCDATLRLGKQMAEAGIARLVFVSTIKVNGESCPADHPFRPDDTPAPVDAYGLAKAEAEDGLRQISGLSLAIIRPPLVHGPGVKGNLAVLMRALRRGLPLPLGAIQNRRSLVGVSNLANALAFLAQSSVQGTFLIRDDDDVSTPELIRLVAQALDRPARLLPVPLSLLTLGGRLLGRKSAVERLAGSLVVDDSTLRNCGWQPQFSLRAGLAIMAAGCDEGLRDSIR